MENVFGFILTDPSTACRMSSTAHKETMHIKIKEQKRRHPEDVNSVTRSKPGWLGDGFNRDFYETGYAQIKWKSRGVKCADKK